MTEEIDNYYLRKREPVKSCLLALRSIILATDAGITETWKYRMPFFCIHGKMFCYVWTDLKTGDPYIGIVEGKKVHHPALIQGARARMKILPLDPKKDLPVSMIRKILKTALTHYPSPKKVILGSRPVLPQA